MTSYPVSSSCPIEPIRHAETNKQVLRGYRLLKIQEDRRLMSSDALSGSQTIIVLETANQEESAESLQS